MFRIYNDFKRWKNIYKYVNETAKENGVAQINISKASNPNNLILSIVK